MIPVFCTSEGDGECHVSGLGGFSGTFPSLQHTESLRPSSLLCSFSQLCSVQPTPLRLLLLWLFLFFFCEQDADSFCVLPTGVREEAMGWTMTLKDDFGVIAWTPRAGSHLSLLLLLSLFSFSVQSDIAYPKDRHFSWRAGRRFNYSSRLQMC